MCSSDLEDPIRPDAPEAYRALRERTSVPIAAGETIAGRRGFKPLLDAAALDVAIVDIDWVGGISEAVKVAALAETYGVGFAPHDCTGPISFAVTSQVIAQISHTGGKSTNIAPDPVATPFPPLK